MNSRIPQALLSGADKRYQSPRQKIAVKFIDSLYFDVREIGVIVGLASRDFIRAVPQHQLNAVPGQKAPPIVFNADQKAQFFAIEGDRGLQVFNG